VSLRVGIVGGGAIGGYLGMLLGAAGAVVTFVERPGRAAASLGIDVSGHEHRPTTEALSSTEASALASVDLCLVSVKSFDTAEVGRTLAPILPPDAPVISFQNGLANVSRLQSALGDRVAGGVVAFNVRCEDGGVRRQLSAGKLLIGRLQTARSGTLTSLVTLFQRRGQPTELRTDISQVMAGKLLLNLNNGVCAATGLGIAESLADPDARWCYAQCIREGARIMREAGLRPTRVAVLPPRLLAGALALPDLLLGPMIRRFGRIAVAARSSTLQDLDRHQRTEIDELNGAIVGLARERGRRAPANDLVTEVVRGHERAVLTETPPSFVAPRELRRRIASALHPTA
jgi:2-dehydropantoate 2-reductase